MESMGAWRDQVDPTPVVFPAAFRRRWYRNHAMAMENLWVVQLSNGRLGTLAGRVLVCVDRDVLAEFCRVNHVTRAQVRKLGLPEGTRIYRLEVPR